MGNKQRKREREWGEVTERQKERGGREKWGMKEREIDR